MASEKTKTLQPLSNAVCIETQPFNHTYITKLKASISAANPTLPCNSASGGVPIP